MSDREFVINTSSQIIARRVKAEPTRVRREQKMSHKPDHHRMLQGEAMKKKEASV